MCLAVPSQIISIAEGSAVVEVEGVRRTVSLALLEKADIGDFVIVHAGFALEILDETAALEVLAYLRDAGVRLAADDPAAGPEAGAP